MSKQQVLVNIQRVTCRDETGGSFVERFGNDEISLSGFGIDATGRAVMFEPFEVFANFDDGEVKEFAPKTILTLDVPHEGPFPKKCTAGFILAETADGVGHREITQKVFAKLTEVIEAKKLQLMGSGVAPLGIDWGVVWEGTRAVLYSYLKGLIESGLNDDVFPPADVSLEISSANFLWGDGTKLSPETTVEFRGHEGAYGLTFYWEIMTVGSPTLR